MKFYKIVVFIFASLLILAMFNTSGIFSGTMPTQTVNTMGTANITELTATNSAESGSVFGGIWGGLTFIASGMGMIWGVAGTVLSIGSVLQRFGVPDYMVTMLMQMLALITIFGIIKFVMGRSDKGID